MQTEPAFAGAGGTVVRTLVITTVAFWLPQALPVFREVHLYFHSVELMTVARNHVQRKNP